MEIKKLSLKQSLRDWFSGLLDNILVLLGSLLAFVGGAVVATVLAGFVAFLALLVTGGFNLAVDLSSIIITACIIIVYGTYFLAIRLGYVKMALSIKQTGSTNIKQLFSCFHLVPRYIAELFIFMIVCIVSLFCATICSIPLILTGIFAIFSPLLVLFFVGYTITRLSLTTFFIVDKNLGVVRAFKKSWAVTKGHVLRLWALYVIFSLLPVYGTLSFASAYEQLVK